MDVCLEKYSRKLISISASSVFKWTNGRVFAWGVCAKRYKFIFGKRYLRNTRENEAESLPVARKPVYPSTRTYEKAHQSLVPKTREVNEGVIVTSTCSIDDGWKSTSSPGQWARRIEKKLCEVGFFGKQR